MAKCAQCGKPQGIGTTECAACRPTEVISRSDRWTQSARSSKVFIRVDGYNGQLVLDDRVLKIERSGALAFLNHGLKGTKEILAEHITSIQFKSTSTLFNGYIQFSHMGGRDAKRGGFEAAKDENSVIFTKSQEPEFRIFKGRLEDRIAELRRPVVVPIAQSNPLDDLERLANLRERGIVTEEEFQAKKRALLGM